MTLLFFILVVIVSVILGLIILVQNPKGGGLSGNVAGFGNQFMGVKQTTDVLEKGTWLFAGIIGLLCIISVIFLGNNATTEGNSPLDRVNTGATPAATTPAAPANTPSATTPTGVTPADSGR